jgi:transcription elongation GreA/GreB family factor
MDKQALLTFLKKQLGEQLNELEEELYSLTEEMGNETKSSAGDKFETAREMMQQSRARLEERKQHYLQQLRILEDLQQNTPSEKVGLGSLVHTNLAYFFFGIALGKLSFEGQSIFVLSLNSPLGKAFIERSPGERVVFMKRSYEILEII